MRLVSLLQKIINYKDESMKISTRNISSAIVAGICFIGAAQTSQAALLGTQLNIGFVYQETSSSELFTLETLDTATVVEPGVEFPSGAALEVVNPPPGTELVDLAINAGDDFLEIDFDNVTQSQFLPAFLNAILFTFDSSAAVLITGASIDATVTTLGLTQSDLTFVGNQLTVNTEGLFFDTSTFARINLASTSAVPIPAATWLFGSGLLGLIGMARRKKAA